VFVVGKAGSSTSSRLAPVPGWQHAIVRKGARIDGINSAALIPFLEDHPDFLIIQSIRQFENPFIPLFFHWSGRYIYPQLVETLVFTIVIPIDFLK
jgi:hypothetical protein